MATAVGAVSVDLSLNSAAFIRDVGKSQKALASNSARMNKALAKMDRGWNKMRRSVKRASKSMISMRGIMVGVAGAAGIGLMVKKSIDFADSIGKTADAIGISTAALQEYRFALDISGVATEKTDKGLKKFVRNMGELARSSSETQTALKDLDPALLKNLRSLNSVEDQLQLGFRALASYTSQSKRAAVAQALFGRAGVDMTVAVKNGSAALEGLRQKARRLGIVLDDALIRNAEKAKDELTILAQVIKVQVVGAVIAFAPEIANLAQKFADGIPKIVMWVQEFGKFVGLLDETALEAIELRIAAINDELERQAGVARRVGPSGVFAGRQAALEAELRILEFERDRLEEIEAIEARRPAPASAPAPGLPQLPALRRGPAAGSFRAAQDEKLIVAMQLAIEVEQDFAAKKRRTAQVISETTEAMNRQADQTLVLITATRQGEVAVRAQAEIFELQNAALSEGIDLTTEQGRAWEAARRRVQMFNKGLEETQRQMEETARQSEEMADGIADVFDRVIDGLARGESAWEAFRDVALSVLRDIQKETIRTLARRIISGDEGGFGVGRLFSGLFGGGGGAPAPVTFGPSAGLQHGGSFTVGGSGGADSQLVAFRASPDERVTVETPAQQRRGGGFTFNDNSVITIDARGAEAGVDRKIRDAMERTQAATVAKVRDLVERGGRFSASFGV